MNKLMIVTIAAFSVACGDSYPSMSSYNTSKLGLKWDSTEDTNKDLIRTYSNDLTVKVKAIGDPKVVLHASIKDMGFLDRYTRQRIEISDASTEIKSTMSFDVYQDKETFAVKIHSARAPFFVDIDATPEITDESGSTYQGKTENKVACVND